MLDNFSHLFHLFIFLRTMANILMCDRGKLYSFQNVKMIEGKKNVKDKRFLFSRKSSISFGKKRSMKILLCLK